MSEIKNPQNLVERIKNIKFQYLNNYDISSYTNEKKVDSAIGIIVGVLKDSPTSYIVDSELPTTILGCTINWSAGSLVNDTTVDVSSGSEVVEHDFTTTYKRMSSTEVYSTALSMAKSLNDNVTVDEISYTETNTDTTLSDSLAIVNSINYNI